MFKLSSIVYPSVNIILEQYSFMEISNIEVLPSSHSSAYPRILQKNGKISGSRRGRNSRLLHLDLTKWQSMMGYFSDLLTTMVDMQWRWNLSIFAMGFLLSWFAFAVMWWMISYLHGDLIEFETNETNQNQTNITNTNTTPCIPNLHSFTGAFLFSIETQTTTGFGFIYLNDECPQVVFALCLQSLVGMI